MARPDPNASAEDLLGTLQALTEQIAQLGARQDRDPRQLLTAGEAADELRVDDKVFRDQIAPRLPKVIPHGCKRPKYMLADLWAYVDRCRREAIPDKPSEPKPPKRRGRHTAQLFSITEIARQRQAKRGSL